MISQIDIEKTLQLQPNKECLFVSVATVLNHVVDAVNELQHDNSEKANCHENVQDKFAEQRKWRYKLCWFWNDGCADYIGILYEIHDLDEIPFENDLGEKYQHCRPVKPDSELIYHGE